MADKDKIDKLKLHLKDLFQFENSDLDFGIYRIINIKRKEIAEFIDKELFDIINEKIKTLGDNSELKKRLELMQKEIEENFGCNIHEAKLKYTETPKVKDYIDKEKELKATEKESEIEGQIYDDIIDFFSRYYDKGDFISKRRYSKDNKYMIPYNGEEVYLYWANNDQYYIKTGENFKSYSFKAGSLKVSFELVSEEVEVEKGNIKSPDKKFFIFRDAAYDDSKKLVTVHFGYRGLTDEETNAILDLTQQKSASKDEVNEFNLKKINERLGLYGLSELQKKHKKMDGQESDISELEWHLNKYTTKNTTDYFIHKNLKRFFAQELDFFIKNEMLNIDDIESREGLDINLNRIKVFKEISLKIIEFLAQIEDFQKMLWEKRKFVISTDYCMTLDYVSERYHPKILENEAQLEEWVKLYSFDIDKEAELIKGKLTGQGKSYEERKIEVLKQNPTLVLDTKFYDEDFKYQLLSEIDDLDEKTNGILIKSENFQALNLLMNKYREKVKCCYIDPPFNTGKDFLYKDSYRGSSWLSLINDRIYLGNNFLTKNGCFWLHLDDNSNFRGKEILKDKFESVTEIIFDTNATKDPEADLFAYKSFGDNFQLKHQTLFYCRNENYFFRKLWKPNRNQTNLNIGWLDLIAFPKNTSSIKISDYMFKIEKWKNGNLELEEIDINEKIYPLGDIWSDIFAFTQSEMRVSESFSFTSSQKPENLLRRIIQSSSEKNDIVLDYFLGIGTTAAVAHKLSRKWIGIEMGDHYSEIYYKDGDNKLGTKGRMKWVLFGDKNISTHGLNRRPHLSYDINWQGGGLFKYQTLEQYEDSLNNIDFTEPNVIAKESKDYKIKYMLEFESKGSKVLLNLDELDNPFEYKLKFEENNELKEKNIDLIETFNYLAGITVKSIKKMTNGPITYVIVKGYQNEKDVIVIWRNKPEGFDAVNDKDFIEKEILKEDYDEILVNGNSLVKDAKSIDEIFKTNMFGRA